MSVWTLRQVLTVLLFLWYYLPMIYALRSGLTKCENLLDFRSFLKKSQEMYSLHLSNTEILENIKKFIPVLTYDQHKGQSGRIGVIGGCEEYTGAPYFAAISALKLGADLSHVFCTKSAAPVIKSYSPELIVHPILDRDDARAEMQKWIPRLHAVVIGPGLGRDPSIIKTVEAITKDLKARNKPLVIDADGLFMVTQNINLISQYKNAIITPNAVEFERLAKAVGINISDHDGLEVTAKMSQTLGGLVIARKQKFDIISDGKSAMQITAVGSPRRCGGQGDLLSGAAAVFYHWALNHQSNHKTSFNDIGPGALSAYAACLLSKLCAESAFSKMGRSTTTTDLIDEIHHVFVNNFEVA